MSSFILALASAMSLAQASPAPQLFQVVPEKSVVTYQLTHKLHVVEGHAKARGRARLMPGGAAQVQVQVDVKDFDSGNANRDEHMQECVEAARFPQVELKAAGSGVTLPEAASATARVRLEGQLTFHGVTRPLAVEASVIRVDAT